MLFQAHKGVSTEAPENTMPAFAAAIAQGYTNIELDVAVTRDGRFVLLHDPTINAMARHEDGTPLQEPVRISDITYEEALAYDFGIRFSKKFKGTRIPLFSDVLALAAAQGVSLKIDNKYRAFSPEQMEAFFTLLAPYETTASLTCATVADLRVAVARFPQMKFHYDGVVTPEILEELSTLLDRDRLTVWIPHKNPNTAWAKHLAFATPELAALVSRYAQLGVWILSTEEQLCEAEALGADIVETNGQLKPKARQGMLADMHTHSEYSHDSTCPISDMRRAQAGRGTAIFAVTDHFDTYSSREMDIFTPAQAAQAEIAAQKSENRPTEILAGIEIGEGFLCPEVYQRAMQMAEYDAVIGSVHLARYGAYSDTYYSGIDFSTFTDEQLAEYMDAYFDDVLTLLAEEDVDILAHLTCPIRYIAGKYGRTLSLEPYAEKLDRIFDILIWHGIALEVNTSAYGVLGETMPSADLLARFRARGGYLITLGSDAHIAENASCGFAQAIEMFKSLGFRHTFFFRARRPYQLSL